MLLAYGNTVCSADWRIDENIPAGYCRVYYVLGGKVQYEDGQRQAALQSGWLYIFPSASPYRMRQDAADPLRCTFMHIDLSPAPVAALIECPVEDNGFLKHLLLALSAAIDAKDRKLVHAMAEVFALYAVEHGLVTPPAHSLSEALLYIAGHIEEAVNVSRLSAMAGYNEQYFIRLIRQSIGVTPYQYVISSRLQAAKKLRAKNESVTRAADLTVYRDIKSFGRTFKKSFGMTPSAFRKNAVVLP